MPDRVQQVVEKAMDAFWQEVAKQYPEITRGDFPPEATITFSDACENAVRLWVHLNSDQEEE